MCKRHYDRAIDIDTMLAMSQVSDRESGAAVVRCMFADRSKEQRARQAV